MTKLDFYRGLLLALRAQGVDGFTACGPRYHAAFGSAVRFAKQMSPTGVEVPLHLHGDKAFGTYDEAEEMIVEGQEDLLIRLYGPALRRVRFRLTQEDAEQELEAIGHVEWFKGVANRMRGVLERRHSDAGLNP
jgi:hypothetical protein